MKWEVEYTDEFGEWWETLSEDEQESIAVSIGLLEIMGPNLPRPHADTVKGSRFKNMKSCVRNMPENHIGLYMHLTPDGWQYC